MAQPTRSGKTGRLVLSQVDGSLIDASVRRLGRHRYTPLWFRYLIRMLIPSAGIEMAEGGTSIETGGIRFAVQMSVITK